MAAYDPAVARQVALRQRMAASARRRNMVKKMSVATEAQGCTRVAPSEPAIAVHEIADKASPVQDDGADNPIASSQGPGLEKISLVQDDEEKSDADAVPKAVEGSADEDNQAEEEKEEEPDATAVDRELQPQPQHVVNFQALKNGRQSFMKKITRSLPRSLSKNLPKKLGRQIVAEVRKTLADKPMEKLQALVEKEIEEGLWM